MLNYEEINYYISNYKVENGDVFNKRDNHKVLNEDIILKVKSSVLIYNEAHSSYLNDMRQFGKVNKSQKDYIEKELNKLSVNGEVTSYGINKLIRGILTSNGHYEEMMSGNDLVNSKFSIFVGKKQDYGLAFLKMKFREMGLDISNFKIDKDLRELQHNGVSKVIIDFKIEKKKTKSKDVNVEINNKNPSFSETLKLNELENEKLVARKNNDDVIYQNWNSMSFDEKTSFIKTNINEAKILNDSVAVDYWTNNLVRLEKNDFYEENINSNEDVAEKSVTMDEVNSEKKKDYQYYYNEMMKAIDKRNNKNLTDTEKRQIVGEIFYNEGYLVKNLNNEEDYRNILNLVVTDLNEDDFKVKIQNIILDDIQEKYEKSFKVENRLSSTSESHNNLEEKSDLTLLITQFRKQIDKVNLEYREMLSDGYVDNDELGILIKKLTDLSDDILVLKPLASNEKEIILLNSIVEMIDKEKQKMITMQNTLGSLK